jgi:hypothetical protein
MMKLKEVAPVVGQKDAGFRSREGEYFVIRDGRVGSPGVARRKNIVPQAA